MYYAIGLLLLVLQLSSIEYSLSQSTTTISPSILTTTEPTESESYILVDDYHYDDQLGHVHLANVTYLEEEEEEHGDDNLNYISSSVEDEEKDCEEGNSLLTTLRRVHGENRHLPVRKNVPHLNVTMQVIDHLVNLTSTLIDLELSQEQIGAALEFFYTANVSDHCFLALAQVAKGVMEQRFWALKFLDAIGKIPTGIAEGSIAHFGEFDECLEIESPEVSETTPGVGIRGQYCLAKFILPYPSIGSYRADAPLYGHRHYRYMVDFLRVYNLDNYFTLPKFIELLNNQRGATLRLGVCFPSACTPDEFEGLLNQILFPVTKMPVELQPDCFNPEIPHHFDSFELASIIIIPSLLLINVICTILDYIFQSDDNDEDAQKLDDNNNNKRKPRRSRLKTLKAAVRCFSLFHNAKALFDVETLSRVQPCCDHACSHQSSPNYRIKNDGIQLPLVARRRFVFLDAIRFILVVNVCIDHMFLFTPFMSFMAFKRILNSVITKVYYYNKYFFARNILIIDTLFIISGIVLSYSLLRKLTLSGGRLQYGTFLLRLWLKYSIPAGAVILLFWILPLTGDGPIWKVGTHLLVPTCKDPASLLSSFAYLSNYRIKAQQNVFHFDPQFALCNPPTWFLSALFQLQVLGPLFVYVIYRAPKWGLLLSGSLVLGGCYAAISPSHLFGTPTYFDGLNISSLEEMVKAFVAFHMGINQYIISFFMGIIVGYLVSHQLVYQRFELSRRVEGWLWAVSIVALVTVMIWFNSLHRINQPAPRLSILLWFSVGKLVGCCAISWMLYALCVGRAVFVEKFFSLGFFRIMSRLSFGIYLLHFIPLTHRLFTVRDTYVMTDKLLFEYIVVDFIQTSFLAAIFHITIERPFNGLVSLIFSRNEFEDVFGKASPPDNGSDDLNESTSTTISITLPSSKEFGPNSDPKTQAGRHGVISPRQVHTSLPSVNLFAANCHEVYLLSRRPPSI